MVARLSTDRKPRFLIISAGNRYRGDDEAGLFVTRGLKTRSLEDVTILEAAGEGTALVEAWKNACAVILVDAVHSGAKPGTLHRFEADARPLPTGFFTHSTHAFGVVEAIELARALDQLPRRFVVYGIEGKCFEAGVGLSAEVEEAARAATERVLHEIKEIFFLAGQRR